MMAININHLFINSAGLNENDCLNNLLDNVSHELDNEFNIISHSKYCNDVDFKEMYRKKIIDFHIKPQFLKFQNPVR